MKSSEDIVYIYERLNEEYPEYANLEPETKIRTDPYVSLISVMLSAQSKDTRTMEATRRLFSLADNPYDMVRLDRDTIIDAIRPAGLYQNKSKNILAASRMLIEEYDGTVPSTQKELMRLPGVGKKSSDIVMRFVFGAPNIAVDTHVFRLLWRLGWADSINETKASITVNETTPEQYKYGAHMQLISHAKRICKSRNPLCSTCVLESVCNKRDIDVPKSRLLQRTADS